MFFIAGRVNPPKTPYAFVDTVRKAQEECKEANYAAGGLRLPGEEERFGPLHHDGVGGVGSQVRRPGARADGKEGSVETGFGLNSNLKTGTRGSRPCPSRPRWSSRRWHRDPGCMAEKERDQELESRMNRVTMISVLWLVAACPAFSLAGGPPRGPLPRSPRRGSRRRGPARQHLNPGAILGNGDINGLVFCAWRADPGDADLQNDVLPCPSCIPASICRCRRSSRSRSGTPRAVDPSAARTATMPTPIPARGPAGR